MPLTDPKILSKVSAISAEMNKAGIGLTRVKHLIRIVGVPGIGKSTLLSAFGPNYVKVQEGLCPILDKAYIDPARWFMCIQTHHVLEIYLKIMAAIRGWHTQRPIVADLSEPRVFAMVNYNMGTVDPAEYIEFIRQCAVLDVFVPGVVIHLRGSAEALKRAQKRGRGPDKQVTQE